MTDTTLEWMRPREAAAYLKTSISTLAKRRLTGDTPKFTRIGRAVRYRRDWCDDWLEGKARRSTSDTGDMRKR